MADQKSREDAKRIVYYFRDLNMPLYLLALYRKGERIKLDSESKYQIEQLVDELVEQYSKQWAVRALSERW
jgi:hypothetical protein